jgi:kynurenine formamidase
MFKDDPKGKTHADVPAHFYEKGYDEGRLDVLNHLLEMAREDESDKIKLAVEYYARANDIKL